MVVDVAVIFLFSTIAPLLSYIIKVVASLELKLSSVKVVKSVNGFGYNYIEDENEEIFSTLS